MKKIVWILLLGVPLKLSAGLPEAKTFYDNQQYNEAAAEAQKVLAENAGNQEAVALLLQIYKTQNKMRDYLALLKKSIEEGKSYDYDTLWNGANLAFQLKDHEKVIFFTKLCNARNPNNHSIYNLIGVSYYYLQKYRLSVIALKTAVAFMPREPIYNANLARSYEMLGKYREAYEYYRISLKNNPNLQRSAMSLKRVEALLKNQNSKEQ